MEAAAKPAPIGGQLLCEDRRCSTVLPADAEICDECGSARLQPLSDAPAVLVGSYFDHPVAFLLSAVGENILGRSGAGGDAPQVDLIRFNDSDSVHHEHAAIELADGSWRLTHRGRNRLVVRRADHTMPVEPGSSVTLESGDGLTVGRVRLQFLVAGNVLG